MTFSLSEEEQNGVLIAVNTILTTAYRVEDGEDWSAQADKWWKEPREQLGGKCAQEMIADEPEIVVRLALETLVEERSRPDVGIYVLPTEEDLPPRAVFLVEVVPGIQSPVGGASFIDGAWRYPDGNEVEGELADAITAHAESLGVEWEH